jgi:hypothetical protein
MSPRLLEISPSVRGKIATIQGFVQRLAPPGDELPHFFRDLARHTFLRQARHDCTEGGAGVEEEEESGGGAAKAR